MNETILTRKLIDPHADCEKCRECGQDRDCGDCDCIEKAKNLRGAFR